MREVIRYSEAFKLRLAQVSSGLWTFTRACPVLPYRRGFSCLPYCAPLRPAPSCLPSLTPRLRRGGLVVPCPRLRRAHPRSATRSADTAAPTGRRALAQHKPRP
jgi:hypothetical protein